MANLDWLIGKKDKFKQMPTLSPEAQQVHSQLLQNPLAQNPLYQAGQKHLQGILSGDTAAFEAPLMRQFQEQIIPGIAEQFAGLGGLSSSAFGQQLGSAAAGLTENLGALRGQLGLQAAQQALPYAQQPYSNLQTALGIGQPETFHQQSTPGLLGYFGQAVAKSAGNRIGGLF